MEEKNEYDVAMETKMEEFLKKSDFKDTYRSVMNNYKNTSRPGATRYNINLDDVRQQSADLAKYLVQKPGKAIQMFEDKANKLIQDFESNLTNDKIRANDQTTFPTKAEKLKLSFDGNLGRNYVTPRGLKANMVNSLVRVQGIVTRMSIVKPKLAKSYHYIPATNQGYVQNYKDQYTIEGQGNFSSKLFPTKDAAGNPMTPDFGYCNYTNVQKLVIQEMPERAPTGQIPRSVNIMLEGDLVDRVKPGDRVEITGVFKCTASHSSTTSGVFRSIILGTGINTISDKNDKIKFTNTDIQNIKKLADRKDLFEVLSSSIAPTVQGHKNIKKSVLLQLLGGNEKNLTNGTHLRGDINILLIGDPSTAKSQMLRHALHLAPIAINTTGRGSSGVGLTAAVSVDKETGERHLEAGAMVLADKGLVCIDEFDKMDDGDRVAIHEVMEQQTVTIAKAGIHASLNARCSVIAAANPIYGDYDRSIPAAKNIGLPDTLLSRFDLLFVVLDLKEPSVDRKIAERVIRNHTYKDPSKNSILNLYQDDFYIEPELSNDEEGNKDTEVYEKSNPVLYGNIDHDVISTKFLQKYIAFAKKAPTPKLTEDSLEFISTAYKTLRQKAQDVEFANQKKLPVTVRTLETLIRLATAHSKLRLNNGGEITTDDLQVALKLMNFAIFDEDDDDVGDDQTDDMEKEASPKIFEESKLAKKSAGKRSKKEGKNKAARDTKGNVSDDPEEEKIQTRNTKVKKEVKRDDTEQVKNLVDFSANSSDDIKTRKKRKTVYMILAKEQKKEHFEVTFSELWDLITKDEEYKKIIESKEDMIQIIHALENTHQVFLTDSNTVTLI